MSEGKSDWAAIRRERRNRVRKAAGDGVVLWLGHVLQARNYADNTYPFRQNSHFLYYVGLNQPDLAVLSFPEEDHDILFWREPTVDDLVWSGPGHTGGELARESGIRTLEAIDKLGECLAQAAASGRKIHYPPPYQGSSLLRIAELLSLTPADAAAGASRPLQEAVARQRVIKSDEEVAEIEQALEVTARMYEAAVRRTRPGAYEYEIAGAMQAVALERGLELAYPPIVTIHGEVLHNHCYSNRIEAGQMLLIDAGAESGRGYAGDITRTYPVSGRFDERQAAVYRVVLQALDESIGRIAPGVDFRDVHIHACKVIAEGMRDLGLMKGKIEDAVMSGAHAFFFPHGLGHMLGLDVHDMEDLGDIAGYIKGRPRSEQFGMKYLRLSRPLETGHVITVEPGIYFIPALFERWREERVHTEFINYDRIEAWIGLGGIRIEDNVLVTPHGAHILGPGIPR